MSDGLREQFRAVADAVAAEMGSVGFKAARGRSEMSRQVQAGTQRLTLLWREARDVGAGFVAACPGVNFAELESLAAGLQGKKPRPGFITCSLDIGLLMPKGSAFEWRLGAGDDSAAVARLITEAVHAFAVPFWDEFASVERLLARYDRGDFRVCRGAEWPWRRVAACLLLGHTARAVSLLDAMRAAVVPPTQPTIERALDRLSSPAAGRLGERRLMRLRYESESGVQVDGPSEGELDALLARLDGVDDSYASLTALDGSGYVQVGGGPAEFTAEVREARPDGTFRHLRAARPDGSDVERRLTVGGADVTVRADEVLDLPTVGQVFRAFLSGRVAAAPVVWHDVTAMFAGTS